jgi:hypothetical protein
MQPSHLTGLDVSFRGLMSLGEYSGHKQTEKQLCYDSRILLFLGMQMKTNFALAITVALLFPINLYAVVPSTAHSFAHGHTVGHSIGHSNLQAVSHTVPVPAPTAATTGHHKKHRSVVSAQGYNGPDCLHYPNTPGCPPRHARRHHNLTS